MADNLGKLADGRTSFAFLGRRDDIWHRKGNQHQPYWTVDDWAANSGLAFQAVKVPAFFDGASIGKADNMFGPAPNFGGMTRVENRFFVVRSDNAHVLSPGTVTNLYQVVQPREVLDWFQQYVAVDPRFVLDTAGALHDGETIWASAVFNGDNLVAGEKHRARLLMTTTFDGTGSTINRGCITRVVCNNTLDAALGESTPTVVRTRHTSKFDALRVGRELAAVVASFASFKAMGDAMAAKHFAEEEMSRFFRSVLEIPLEAKKDDISARKQSQLAEILDCYQVGVHREGLDHRSGWAMLQAITRYADHNKSVRGANGHPEAAQDRRFGSSVIEQGGSGAQMKTRAVKIIDDLMAGALRVAADHARALALADDRTARAFAR